MRFTANRLKLLAAAEMVQSTVPKRSTLPILETIQLTVSSQGIELRASNLDTHCIATVRLPDGPEGECFSGSVLVPADRFVSLLKLITGTYVTVNNPPFTEAAKDGSVQYSSKIHIESENGRSTYSVTGESTKDYPPLPHSGIHHRLKLDDEIRTALTRAIPFASEDELRPAMTGILVDNNFEQLTVVSTNGHKLYCNVLAERQHEPWTHILNTHGLRIALKYGVTHVGFNETQSIYQCGNLTVISRLIDEQYPPWQTVVPQASEMKAVAAFSRAESLQLIRRITMFAYAKVPTIRMSFAPDQLTISAQDIEFGGEGTERMPSCYNRFDGSGDPFEISFNGRYIEQVFSVLKSDAITMRLWSPTRGVMFVTDNDHEQLLLMPCRLTDAETIKDHPLEQLKQSIEVISEEKRAELMPGEHEEPLVCANCEREVQPEDTECWNCHAKLEPQDTTPCPGCGKPIEESDSVCPHCDEELYTCDSCEATMLFRQDKCPACGWEYEPIETETA